MDSNGYSNIDDTDLALMAQKKDDVAFQELMRRHIKAIWTFSRYYTKNNEDTDDIVQDTFFKAWKYLKRFEAGKTFRPWLYAIARNTALDYLKKRRPTRFSELNNPETDTEFADTLEDTEPSALELFELRELAKELDTAMIDINPEHRTVLIMHYQEDLTFKEIAGILDKPMNTVKSWHRRALQNMKKQIPHHKP